MPYNFRYNKICGLISKLTNKLSLLKPEDPFRTATADQLVQKLFLMGILPTQATLSQCSEIAASAFCRRRLPVVMVSCKMAETLKEAVTLIEQGRM